MASLLQHKDIGRKLNMLEAMFYCAKCSEELKKNIQGAATKHFQRMHLCMAILFKTVYNLNEITIIAIAIRLEMVSLFMFALPMNT